MNKEEKLTIQKLDKYIEIFQSQHLPRLQKLERYYLGKNDKIMNRTFTDKSKPNNKIAHSYAGYITDNMSSYFMGEPLVLNAEDKDMLSEYNNIMDYTDTQSTDNSLARDQSIFGVGYEMIYMDEDKHIRTCRLNPKQTFVIYNNDLDKKVLYGVRLYDTEDIISNEKTINIEVYTNSGTLYYTKTTGGITPSGNDIHYFKSVPVSVYENNDYCVGDFETIIPLIDALDMSVSDTSNNLEYFNDAFLLFLNANLEDEDIIAMKEQRIISVESGDGDKTPDVRWLNKNANDLETENYKSRLVKEIHKLSKMPDLSESMMKSHVSAEAVRMSLLTTEQVVAIKEAKFKKGKQKTLYIITTVLNMLGEDYDYRDIDITFTRNIPQSLLSWADIASKLRGLISDETLISQLPFVTNVELEMSRIKEQNSMNSYSDFEDEVDDGYEEE